ncbi:8526_t:CDS:2 [Paraglomus occultum]|uniref:8526_t:CDS:1 n=1 Tax=Paraglomus occultum TaxID=144539 RepID=A0A9N8WBN9_9GLOM|nr:8526_t:CDS:2 [Paraglomus occultum]
MLPRSKEKVSKKGFAQKLIQLEACTTRCWGVVFPPLQSRRDWSHTQ